MHTYTPENEHDDLALMSSFALGRKTGAYLKLVRDNKSTRRVRKFFIVQVAPSIRQHAILVTHSSTSNLLFCMKRLLLLLLLLSFFQVEVRAQSVQKLRVVGKSERRGQYAEWSDFETLNVLAVMNTDDISFTFYGAKTLRYDVLHIGDMQEDKDGDQYCMLDCIDNDGDKTTGKMIFYKNSSRKQLYFFYPNLSFCYELRSVSSNGE